MPMLMLRGTMGGPFRRVLRDAKGEEAGELSFLPGVPTEVQGAKEIEAIADSIGPALVFADVKEKSVPRINEKKTREFVEKRIEKKLAELEKDPKDRKICTRLNSYQESVLREMEAAAAADADAKREKAAAAGK